ncbi:MAG: DUF1156 domain-containing protein [Ruminiclostridium sp.]|nr:DUF1156 domain-containing protein [Ruminiclostridium sp.]
MNSKKEIIPFSLKDTPTLIEKLLPVQKLSAESYKEQMAGQGKTLTALGSYWKGRKPLILNKACILGCLLPSTANPKDDLLIFEKLMAMDDESFVIRFGRIRPSQLVQCISLPCIYDYFTVEPERTLPETAPFNLGDYRMHNGKLPNISWRSDISENMKRQIEKQALPQWNYRKMVDKSSRAECCLDVHDHIWNDVNTHLGTDAHSFPELIEQIGIMRFGHRPRIADTFCGSGQIPFEAAFLGCDVYASDLNPIACMLTWGAFNIVGGSLKDRELLTCMQKKMSNHLQNEIDKLGVEADEKGRRAKVYLYCMEVVCPQTGWKVPLMPSCIVSKGYKVIAELAPDTKNKCYDIIIRSNVNDKDLMEAEKGTIRSDGRGQEPYMIHAIDGKEYRTKISTLRGDYRKEDGSIGNKIRPWEKSDFKPRKEDIFQERLYAIQWVREELHHRTGNVQEVYEFCSVTEADLSREKVVENYISKNLVEWQNIGWIPDMRIEPGEKTSEPIRTRGWTYWHHLFNPRQLLVGALLMQNESPDMPFVLGQVLNVSCKCTRWNPAPGPGRAGATSTVFDNQAINTLFNYGCRATSSITSFIPAEYKSFPINYEVNLMINCATADSVPFENDIYITDPPYGDAVKYEEIFEFFIAWLRKNPTKEFKNWIWDSRRSLSIKGEDESFRQGMVAAYKKMNEKMPENGIQIIMFTHQSGSIWSDMANIVWAAGLQVTAAWYVVTETDSALREGSYVKGTVLLILRKRKGVYKASRGDLAWEIQEEVEMQVNALSGLNQEAKGFYRDENLFEDADIQMAGYAAALRVLTRYAIIDGRDMTIEAIRPRIVGQKTFVDEMIEFAVDIANQCLVPNGIHKTNWDKLLPSERFYLKLFDLEAKGINTLDNYQNFAKAFKVKDYKPFLASQKANSARLKSAVELGRSEMSGDSEFANTVLRGILYALMEIVKNIDGYEVLAHLAINILGYYNQGIRELIVELSDYLAKRLENIRSNEASAARILRDLVKNQHI